MKYSFMSFSTPNLTLSEMLATAKRFGYDGIEPRIDANHKHGVEVSSNEAKRREIKKQTIHSGIKICCIASSCKYTNPETTKNNTNYTIKCIDLAADVGSPRLRVFGGKIDTGISREEATELVTRALSSVADHASQRNVTVCMETHDGWCNPEDLAKVMKQVNHPAVGVNWDVMHPVRAGFATMDQAFQTLKPWIRHVHVHDAKTGTRLVPIGTGDYDHERAIQLLLSISYEGYLSGEWIKWEDPYDIHLPRELASLKKIEAKSMTPKRK